MNEPRKRISTPEEDHWREHLWATKQQTPERIEDAAKFLATMISLSFSILLTLGKSDVQEGTDPYLLVVKFALGCWLLAALLAFWVLMPERYFFKANSTQSFREAHGKVVFRKYYRLVASVVFFVVGMGMLFVRFLVT